MPANARLEQRSLTTCPALVLIALQSLVGFFCPPHVRADIDFAGAVAVFIEIDGDLISAIAFNDLVLRVLRLVGVDRSNLIAHFLQFAAVEGFLLPDLHRADQLLFASLPAALVIAIAEAGVARVKKTRSEEHTSEFQSPSVISYAVFCF